MSQWAEPRVAIRNRSVPVVIDCAGGGKTCKNHLIVEDILIVTNDSRTVHVCVCACIHSDNYYYLISVSPFTLIVDNRRNVTE